MNDAEIISRIMDRLYVPQEKNCHPDCMCWDGGPCDSDQIVAWERGGRR